MLALIFENQLFITDTPEEMLQVLFKGNPPPGIKFEDVKNFGPGASMFEIISVGDYRK